jgi:hypothetical protein
MNHLHARDFNLIIQQFEKRKEDVLSQKILSQEVLKINLKTESKEENELIKELNELRTKNQELQKIILTLDVSMQISKPSTKKVKEKTWLISYADGGDIYHANQRALMFGALNNCIDHIVRYNREDLDVVFTAKNQHILSESHGAGFWLWKPYIILKALEESKPGDMILYLDSSVLIKNDLGNFFNLFEKKDIILTQYHSFPNKFYVKKNVFEFMGMDNEEAQEAQMIAGSLVAVRNTTTGKEFIKKWLNLCENKDLLTHFFQTGSQRPDFKFHCHDQSILSLLYLQEKDNIEVIQYSYDEFFYFFNHHRRRNFEKSLLVKP